MVSASSFNFDGKVALVTGGGSGIGRATSILFARHGAKVVIADISPAATETAEAIKGEGGEALFVRTDVSKASDVQQMVAAAVDRYGGLHCAFNNAGILPVTAALADAEESDFDRTFAIDVKGVFLAMKYEIQHMLRSGGGAIVNNASIAGMIAEPGISSYVAAKHAVIGLTKSAAIEYAAHGLRINAIAPVWSRPPMTKDWFENPEMRSFFLRNSPIGRFAQPEEMANVVLFLCSELASFAVGQTFAIDGGYTAH